jgi:hypothetical protein
VYGKPVFNILEGRVHVILVNAEHIQRVPDRKTDVKDCQWIAQLLRHGLLKAGFVPPAPIRELRDLTRQRTRLIQKRSAAANRIQKGAGGRRHQAGQRGDQCLGGESAPFGQGPRFGEARPEQSRHDRQPRLAPGLAVGQPTRPPRSQRTAPRAMPTATHLSRGPPGPLPTRERGLMRPSSTRGEARPQVSPKAGEKACPPGPLGGGQAFLPVPTRGTDLDGGLGTTGTTHRTVSGRSTIS